MEKVRFAVLVLAGRREEEVVSTDGEEGKSPEEMDWMSASFSVSGISPGSWKGSGLVGVVKVMF